MKRICLVVAAVVVSLIIFAVACYAEKAAKEKSGEELFKQHCAVCHQDGGNIIDPKDTLHRKDLKAHKITKPADIVKIMRNPGQGMTKFDKKTIPDKDAQKIAQYILKTFK
jgi:cytochrome c6